MWLRKRLTPTDSGPNRVARLLFIASASTAGVAFFLSGITVFASDTANWAFTILFWFGLMLSIPTAIAVILTGRSEAQSRGT